MRLGKSPQSIVAADRIKAKRILVVCPAVARIGWLRAFEKFSVSKRRDFQILFDGKELPDPKRSVIVSYDLASKIKNWGGRFDVLIVDEVHFLKSMDTRRSRAIFGAKGVCRLADRTWALTGTPMPNAANELWVLMYTFGATKLRYEAFATRFCEFAPGYNGRFRIVGTRRDRIGELKALLAPIMLRRTKEEVMPELPAMLFSDVSVEPGPVVLKDCTALLEYALPQDRSSELFGKITEQRDKLTALFKAGIPTNFMRALEGLAQSVSTLTLYNGLQKVVPVAEMVKGELELGLYDKIVIFATHRDVIDQLYEKLKKFAPVKIYGGQTEGQRQASIDLFQSSPHTQIALCNIRAAGTAISLSAATEVLFVEREWSPNDNLQAAKRCDLYDQKRAINVRFVHIANSIDEKVGKILRRKTRDITLLFDATPHAKAVDEFKPI